MTRAMGFTGGQSSFDWLSVGVTRPALGEFSLQFFASELFGIKLTSGVASLQFVYNFGGSALCILSPLSKSEGSI